MAYEYDCWNNTTVSLYHMFITRLLLIYLNPLSRAHESKFLCSPSTEDNGSSWSPPCNKCIFLYASNSGQWW